VDIGDNGREIDSSPQRRMRAVRRALPVAWIAAALTALAAGVLPATAAAGRLDAPTWADEFTADTLDVTRWAPRAGGERHDGILTPDAVTVQDGVLSVTTYTEDDVHYSGMIATHGGSPGLQQAFGYFEVRARFSGASGQWSAFWLQSPTIGMPLGDPGRAGVEMDVVEHRTRCVTAPAPTPPATCGPDSDITDRAQQALVWDGYEADGQSAVNLTAPLPGLDDGGWHTWALNWTPTSLTFSFDDQPIWLPSGPVSQRSQYIVLSSEVGAFFAGAIPAAGYGSRATSTTKMQVDYVRVWQTPTEAAVSTGPPVASGPSDVGGALACSSGTWSGPSAPALQYGWLSDGAPIAGAAAPSYTVRPADRGHGVACRVTATNTGGATGAVSNAIAIPEPAPAALAAPLSPPPVLAEPPPPPVDTTAPSAALSGARTQTVAARVAVSVSCRDEPCAAGARGTVRVPRLGRAKAWTYTARSALAIRAGATAKIRLKLSASARAAIRRGLRSHKRIAMRVAVHVKDRVGNARTLRRTITFKLAATRPAR
jgi:beta-glucanase (GH16 family)